MDPDVFQTSKKFFIILAITCKISICNHPFVVAMVLVGIILYKSSPLVFSLLVSSSPIIISTAILLGTLLSFGQPNIPEIEKEDKRTHETASMETVVSEDVSAVVKIDGNTAAESLTVRRRGITEETDEETSLIPKPTRWVERDDPSVDDSPLIDANSRGVQCQKQGMAEFDEELDRLDSYHKKKIIAVMEDKGINGGDEEVEKQYQCVRDVKIKNNEGELNKFMNDVAAADKQYSSLGSWKHADDDAESSDSGSDGSESSSPDASIADIIPMLDELHPLLDVEAPQTARNDFDSMSQQSNNSCDASDELEEYSENQGEDGDDDVDDDEDAQGGKEDVSKSAITWTEDDQKNLMNLGTSELERNQRLENLIARRRSRKNMRMMAEKNLIDLECTDLPFHIAPISTTRRNPFDLPNEAYDEVGLLAVPGSAPSVLLPRRNPFDLPYDSSEEKPDLSGDGFQQEFMPLHHKDTVLRRHETFSYRTSVLGGTRQERHDRKFSPFFVPERSYPEGTSHPPFQRQSSEMSDSQLSSVAETESTGSTIVEQEDEKILEVELSQGDVIHEQMPRTQIPIFESFLEDHEKNQEPSASKDSTQVAISAISNGLKAHVPEDEVNTSSSLTLGDISVPFENLGKKISVSLEEDIIHGVENRAQTRVLKDIEFAEEGSRHMTGESDKIEDIDEHLLLELDTVGDFSVKTAEPNMDEIEGHLAADQESPIVNDADRKFVEGVENDYGDVNKTIAVVWAEDNSDSNKIMEDEREKPVVVGSPHTELIPEPTEVGLSNKDSNLDEKKCDLPMKDACSVKEIDLAFDSLNEEINEKSVVTNLGDGRGVVDESIGQLEIRSKLHVEALTLDDTSMPSEQPLAGELGKMPESLGTRDGTGQVEIKEVGSPDKIEPAANGKAAQENTSGHEKQNGGAQNPEISDLSNSDVRTKKSKSCKSGSDSSSSSDSSCSDSD